MSKKIWFYMSIGLLTLLLLLSIEYIHSSNVFVEAKETNLQTYLELSPDNNHLPEEGYISDCRTAAKIGGEVIDTLCKKGILDFGSVTVEYDPAKRIWKIHKGYLFSSGGFVIIKQDTGEIVKALFDK